MLAVYAVFGKLPSGFARPDSAGFVEALSRAADYVRAVPTSRPREYIYAPDGKRCLDRSVLALPDERAHFISPFILYYRSSNLERRPQPPRVTSAELLDDTLAKLERRARAIKGSPSSPTLEPWRSQRRARFKFLPFGSATAGSWLVVSSDLFRRFALIAGICATATLRPGYFQIVEDGGKVSA
ncbi:hypothetical protein KM043_000565 [Ampulex compressa]|nr:hypothetical protein KM043_000565 [Ampulex compressa]